MKLFVSFVTFLLLLDTFSTAQTLIQDFCKKASAKDPNLKYDFCVNSLQQDQRSKTATSLKGLLLASIKTAAEKDRSVIDFITERTGGYGKDIGLALYNCVEHFTDATDEFNESLSAMKLHDYKSVNMNLKAASRAPSACDDEFKKIKQQDPITNENNVLYQKILIPLALTNML